ncbi:MAG: hypothetical protein WA294_01630 [Acidobacteriaceae bacterium]
MLAIPRLHDAFAVARIRDWLAAIAGMQGNHKEEITQLNLAMIHWNTLGPRVEYGAILGQAWARAGEAEKAREILNTIAPITNDRIEDQVGYLALLKAEVAAASGDPRGALQFLKPPSPDDPSSPAALTREAWRTFMKALAIVLRRFCGTRNSSGTACLAGSHSAIGRQPSLPSLRITTRWGTACMRSVQSDNFWTHGRMPILTI